MVYSSTVNKFVDHFHMLPRQTMALIWRDGQQPVSSHLPPVRFGVVLDSVVQPDNLAVRVGHPRFLYMGQLPPVVPVWLDFVLSGGRILELRKTNCCSELQRLVPPVREPDDLYVIAQRELRKLFN